MTSDRREGTTDTGLVAVRIFAANERINQMLIEHLAPEAWTATPVGGVRRIPAIFAHMHRMRCKWVRLSAPRLKVPAPLGRVKCSPRDVSAALAESARCCGEMLGEAIADNRRVETFVRDGWARPWPVGPEMLCYMVAHEAHHRGQVCLIAHQAGFPLEDMVTSRMWNWEKLLFPAPVHPASTVGKEVVPGAGAGG